MEKFKTNCSKCGGFGHLDISHQPEPWMAFYVRCNYCHGDGWIYNEDKIKDKIFELDCMINGMIQRIKNFQFMVTQCQRGLLFELADKFDNRVNICSIALGRLTKYRNKLNKMI